MMRIQRDAQFYDIQMTSGGDLVFQHDGAADDVTFDTDGNVGIGIASPGHKLDVRDDSLTTTGIANFYSNSSDTNTRNLVMIDNDHASADATTCLRINQDGDGPAISLIGSGGGGIKFQASMQNSSDANTLDDYEEGYATISFTAGSGTLTKHSDRDTIAYVKIGKTVHIQGQLNITSVSGNSGEMAITGLPFTAEGLTELSEYAAIEVWLNGTDDVTAQSFVGVVRNGEDEIKVYFFNGTNIDNAAGYMNNNTDVYIGGTYMAV